MPKDTTKAAWHDTIPEATKTYYRTTIREIGKLNSNIQEVRTIVSPLGEGDPIKWAQTLPGVTTGADGSATMYVRGGNTSNNLISLDGIPLYGYTHILGLTTVVPQSVLSSVTLLKGGFEGRDGNFSASHLKMQTKTPQQGFKAAASVNTFLAEVYAEGGFGKWGALVSARVSPLGLEYKAVKGILPSFLQNINNFKAGVGDTYGKIRYSFTDKIYLELSGLLSVDNYIMSLSKNSYENFGWKNSVASLLFHANGRQSTSTVQVYFDNYSNYQRQDKLFRGEMNHLNLTSTLEEITFKADREDWFGKKQWFGLSYGGCIKLQTFSPGQMDNQDKKETNTTLSSLFIQSNTNIPDILKMRLFARRTIYGLKGIGVQLYNNKNNEYGAWVQIPIGGHLNIEATYDETYQYFHSLEGLPTGWSLDILVPSYTNIKPERTQQVSAGLSANISKHNFTATYFTKNQNNIPFYKYSQSLFSDALAKWERYVEWGYGKSYGGEFMYEYDGKDFYARMAYTISKTTRFGYPSINDGKEFHPKFDRTHILTAFLQWKSITAAVTFQSGNWENGAPDSYIMDNYPTGSVPCEYFFGYNHYRMPMIFRIDLGWNKIIKSGRLTHDIRVGVCNVTNHFNPFMLYYDADIEQFKALSLLPILPNFSYKVGF